MISSTFRFVCLTFLLCALSLPALAASLGEIQIHSTVGEPFSATIIAELDKGQDDELDRMVAQIASAETHEAFGINFDSYLSYIDVQVQPTPDGVQFGLTGRKSLKAFHLEFIFELRFMTGSVYRSYVVLPDFDPRITAGLSEPDLPRATSSKPRSSAQQTKQQTKQQTRQQTKKSTPLKGSDAVPSGKYTVRNLDSIWLIASRMEPSLGDVEQRIALLLAMNPSLQGEQAELHPGDVLVIAGDTAALSTTPPQSEKRQQSAAPAIPDRESQRPSNADSGAGGERPASGAETGDRAPQTTTDREKARQLRAQAEMTDAEVLAGVMARARGHAVVRLAALSGPQIYQAASGETSVVSAGSENAPLALELAEIRKNLEMLSTQNVALQADIQRLEDQQKTDTSATTIQRESLPVGLILLSMFGILAVLAIVWLLLLRSRSADKSESEADIDNFVSSEILDPAAARSLPEPGSGIGLDGTEQPADKPDEVIHLATDSVESSQPKADADLSKYRPPASEQAHGTEDADAESVTSSGVDSETEEEPMPAMNPADWESEPDALPTETPISVESPGLAEEQEERPDTDSTLAVDPELVDSIVFEDRAHDSAGRGEDAISEPVIADVGDSDTHAGDSIKFDSEGAEGTQREEYDESPVAPAFGSGADTQQSADDEGIQFDPDALASFSSEDGNSADEDVTVIPGFGGQTTSPESGIEFDPTAMSTLNREKEESSAEEEPVMPAFGSRRDDDEGIEFDSGALASLKASAQQEVEDADEVTDVFGSGGNRADDSIEFERDERIEEEEIQWDQEQLEFEAGEEVEEPEELVWELGEELETTEELEELDDESQFLVLDDDEEDNVADPVTEEIDEVTVAPELTDLPNPALLASMQTDRRQAEEFDIPPMPEVSSQRHRPTSRWSALQDEFEEIQKAEDADENVVDAMFFVELDDMSSVENQQGPIQAEQITMQVKSHLLAELQAFRSVLHQIKDYSFVFIVRATSQDELQRLGETLVQDVRAYKFLLDEEEVPLTLSVAIIPFTTSFSTLDEYLHCGKVTVAQLRADVDDEEVGDGVSLYVPAPPSFDWEDEEVFVQKVGELLEKNQFVNEYQTLINLTGSFEKAYMCKTELTPDVEIDSLPEDFFKKAFGCSATTAIERNSIDMAIDKVLSMRADNIKILFRIDIRSAMDPRFEAWLFSQLETRKVDASMIVLFVYAEDVIEHRAHITRFASRLRKKGIKLGMLNVNYDANHLQAAIDVGASIIRVSPVIVDEVCVLAAKGYDRRTSDRQVFTRLQSYLTGFHNRSIETVLFSTDIEAIPGLVVLNAGTLRATYIQTPIGMIEEDAFGA